MILGSLLSVKKKKKNLHGKEEFLPNVFNCLESFVAPEGAAQYRTEYVMSFKSAGAEDYNLQN